MPRTQPAADAPAGRRALLVGLAGVVASTAPGLNNLASAAPGGADAVLIRACNQVVALECQMEVIYAGRHSIADEHLTEGALEALHAQQAAIIQQLRALPPATTLPGVRALAEAARAYPIRDRGEVASLPDCEWLSVAVVECLARGVAA